MPRSNESHPNVIPVESPPINTPQWEQWRRIHARTYVSASEAAAATGLSPFQSPKDLMAHKLWPEEQPPDKDRDWRFLIAHRTQPLLIDLANHINETGPLDHDFFTENSTTFRHAEIPWQIGTPDGFTQHKRPLPVEVKFTSGWAAENPPAHIMAQLLMQSTICEAPAAMLVVARPHVLRHIDVTVIGFNIERMEQGVGGAEPFFSALHQFWAELQPTQRSTL